MITILSVAPIIGIRMIIRIILMMMNKMTLMMTKTMISAQENSPPPNPMVYEDSFNRTLQSALLNLGKTGQ